MIESEYQISFEELKEILQLIEKVHGYDFNDYAEASLKRRVTHIMNKLKLNIFDLKHRLVNDTHFFALFLNQITVNVTEMFRDPGFYRSVRENVIPYLASYPHIKIWNAGCSSGEETYSFAITLKEEGILEKSFLYGTDINSEVLDKAKEGIYELKKIKEYSTNYLNSGGKSSLSDYYHSIYDAGIFQSELRKKTLFSIHNLASDSSFNEFQLVVCRNVLIYFNEHLRNRVLQLFTESLCHLGFLCLGSKETLRNPQLLEQYKVIDRRENIYQKIV
ncbi:protein-glutamate O-methyltransferase CheR [Echinicola sp. CAU 1574]|uniref:Protein-glutamate O-methyltransferase CheR n=1 Tax=Echinicola arenosa TaxID=2774144 RepID=A0ABR9AUL5_9BACT|nr:protein-glutamate O-methyltransferase CheR [Echinicola arenosa]MBD8491299.1 protein-glutamate O-methyltransferase CheR [Echinicola arenosa]